MESRHSPATTHRCEAKIRAGGTCLVRVEPGKSRCRFHGVSTGPKTEQGRAPVAEPQQCRWRAYRASLSTKSVGDSRPGGPPRPDSPEAAGAFTGLNQRVAKRPGERVHLRGRVR